MKLGTAVLLFAFFWYTMWRFDALLLAAVATIVSMTLNFIHMKIDEKAKDLP